MTVQAGSDREPCLCREQGDNVRGFVATNPSLTTTVSRLLPPFSLSQRAADPQGALRQYYQGLDQTGAFLSGQLF